MAKINLLPFNTEDGDDKLTFLKNANLEARGFNIIGAFDNVETVDEMRLRIKGIRQTFKSGPYEKIFFWIMRDDDVIGVATLRPKLDDFWRRNAGHIGIAIDEPYRKQGFGSEALETLCKKAAEEYMVKDILVAALVDNVPSRRMIENSGGKYYDTIVAADGEKLARYWIHYCDKDI